MMLEKHHIAAIQAAVVIQITQHYLRVCRSDLLNDQPDQNQVITGIDNAIRFVAWRQVAAVGGQRIGFPGIDDAVTITILYAIRQTIPVFIERKYRHRGLEPSAANHRYMDYVLVDNINGIRRRVLHLS